MRARSAEMASASSAGQNRDRHGQAVDKNDTNLKNTDDGEHCLSRHVSFPGHFQRAQSASISSSFPRCLNLQTPTSLMLRNDAWLSETPARVQISREVCSLITY